MDAKKEFLKVLEEVLGDYGFSPLIAWALRFFLRNPYETLIVVNKKGEIEFMDRGSEKFFGLPPGGAKGVKITELIPNSVFPIVLETGIPVIGRVFKVKDVHRISSTYPLIKDGEIIGAIGHLILRSLEEVERINKEMNQLKDQIKSLQRREEYRAIYTFENILGESPAIKEALQLAKKVALLDTDVLIIGESGTGKELFAHAIHNFRNPESPFVRVNAPAIPFELAESELFGYEKGAFTGASSAGKPGKFELAHNGTIFIDEIASLPLSIQAKLLRVLQEKEIERLGSTKVKKVNFRMIATSNVDLKKMVKEGKFREDLYYRIAKVVIHIPPLRERKEDIPILVNYFLEVLNKQFGTRFKRLSQEAFLCFMNYDWPGNVRELINVLEQAMLKTWEGEEIPLSSLPSELTSHFLKYNFSSNNQKEEKNLKKEIKEKEKELILQALKKTKGNKCKAALLLGMPRSTLYKKLKEYNITNLAFNNT